MQKSSIRILLSRRAHVCVRSRRAGAEDQGENGSGEEENQPGDHRAERQTKSQQREHQPPEGRDQETGGGRRPQGALRNGQHTFCYYTFLKFVFLFNMKKIKSKLW